MIEKDVELCTEKLADPQKMKIAFRYEYLPTSEISDVSDFNHYFDLSEKMDSDKISSTNIFHWDGDSSLNRSESKTCYILFFFRFGFLIDLLLLFSTIPDFPVFSNPAYYNLLEYIKNTLKEHKLFLRDKVPKQNILRIGIHALGSPLWLPDVPSVCALHKSRDLDMFLYCLRALLRYAYAVAFITVPTHLYDEVNKKC